MRDVPLPRVMKGNGAADVQRSYPIRHSLPRENAKTWKCVQTNMCMGSSLVFRYAFAVNLYLDPSTPPMEVLIAIFGPLTATLVLWVLEAIRWWYLAGNLRVGRSLISRDGGWVIQRLPDLLRTWRTFIFWMYIDRYIDILHKKKAYNNNMI